MKTISYEKLVEKIAEKPGTVIVGLLALTDAKARKTGNPFPNSLIFKQVRAVGFVGVDYESAVNREAQRQGGKEDFETEKLPWGEWLILNKVIQHNGEFYLRTQTTPGNRRVQPARVLAYRDANGKFIARDEAKKFLPPVYESAKQQEQTGIKKTVWVRIYKFSSIQKIRIAGQTYLVGHPAKTEEIKQKYQKTAEKVNKLTPQGEHFQKEINNLQDPKY